MKVVLLGAGASFGSGPAYPDNPPLGKDLFRELENLGGVAASLPYDLKELFKNDFESGMRRYLIEFPSTLMDFQRELAWYIAKFFPLPGNIFMQLISDLGTSGIVYSSLNYDLMVECSVKRLDLSFHYTNAQKPNFVSLLKIHGSCNFWHTAPVGFFSSMKIYGSGEADLVSDVIAVDQKETLYRCEHDLGVAPAMAMYAEGKPIKISPKEILDQQRQWSTSVLEAKKIAIIGVKILLEDHHIWGPLSETKAAIWYVGRPQDRYDFDNWKLRYPKLNAIFLELSFADCTAILKECFSE